ncbi:uncharacterized protein LOC144223754 [Crocuta crocuta]
MIWVTHETQSHIHKQPGSGDVAAALMATERNRGECLPSSRLPPRYRVPSRSGVGDVWPARAVRDCGLHVTLASYSTCEGTQSLTLEIIHTSFSNTVINFTSMGFSQRSFLPENSGSYPQKESWDQCFQSSDTNKVVFCLNVNRYDGSYQEVHEKSISNSNEEGRIDP